jgi:hypothetical protein
MMPDTDLSWLPNGGAGLDKTVPCRLCGAATRMESTKLCDRCWELEKRIHANPEVARKILDALRPITVQYLRERYEAEIEKERLGLMDISGPTGMRNSQASALGLARNSMRAEFLAHLAALDGGAK